MESLVRVAINNGPKVGWQIAKNIKVSPTLLELTSASLIETAFNWVTPLVGFGTILVEAAYLLVYRWYWKRDITGKQVAKRVFDSFCVVFSSVLGSIAMGTACGAIGGLAGGPAFMVGGSIVGGLAGGLGAGLLASTIIDKLTQDLFDLPPTEALEKAYNILEVHHKAENSVVNVAFKRLALVHHPDKGGDKEKFMAIQSAFLVIKAAREKQMKQISEI
uniref:J domain-containing protein n=1 Tax=Acrobeloides nanus TaxID=290746 RepID=A0A914CS43_9BILA